MQLIDYEQLIELAMEHKLVVSMLSRAGFHVLSGQTVALVAGRSAKVPDIKQLINDSLIIGDVPNPTQDLEFAIRQLVEIALRALSPGINDPFTAISCIDRLSTLINFVMRKSLPQSVVYDSCDTPRLLIKVSTFEGIVEAAFNQIRQNATEHVDVVLHLLETLTKLIELTDNKNQANPLYQQGLRINDGIDERRLVSADRGTFDERFSVLKDCYESKNSQ